MKTSPLARFLICLTLSVPARCFAESFASWSAKAEKAAKRRDTVSALEAYTNALHLWKKSDGKKPKAKLLSARADLYTKSGSPDAALKDLNAAIKLDPGASSAFFHRGRIEYDQNRLSDAISDFYKATKLNLNYREAYLYRGLSYERQGDAKFAKEDFKTACRLGLKAACTESSRARVQTAGAPGVAPADAFEAAVAPGAPKKRVVTVVKKKKTKPAYKLDWQACLDGLNACVEAGESYGDCVKKTKPCESSKDPACCPRDCVKKYNELVDQGTVSTAEGGASEASAFRQIFGEKPDCASP